MRKPIRGTLVDLSQAERFYVIKTFLRLKLGKYTFVVRLETDQAKEEYKEKLR